LPYVASPLVYRGHVFLIKDGGIVTLLDAQTGKLVKQARAGGEGNYYASPVGGDGKIYAASTAGAVTVFEAGSNAKVLFSRDFQERIAATPVLADGRVYLRTGKALYCFENR
jgi:outer membrane protein assembly factor BamB